MQPWQERVIDERSELNEKTDRLNEFLNSGERPYPEGITREEILRLRGQLPTMQAYLAWLDLRIGEFPAADAPKNTPAEDEAIPAEVRERAAASGTGTD